MKIVSFNMHFGGKTGPNNSWQRLIAEVAPDIVFAQESFHPEEYLSAEALAQFTEPVWKSVPGRKWGSAILSKNHQLEPVTLQGFEGWVVGAEIPDLVVGGIEQRALVFSIHAPSPGPYEPVVKAILDAIAKRWSKTPMIIAGDFNVTTAFRHSAEKVPPPKNTAGERKFLNRMRREFGMMNAWQVLHPNEDLPQTLRWSKDPVPPYHCDAVFLSHAHLAHLSEATIENSGVWSEMSDHNPIIVTLD